MSGVLVIAEHREGALRDATLEALGAARASGLSPVVCLAAAASPAELAGQVAPYCDKVLAMAHESLSPPLAMAWLPAVRAAVESAAPSLVLAPHSSWGMELMPRLAAELDAPYAPDVSSFEIADTVSGTRSVYGGKLNARWELAPSPLYVLTLRGGSFAPAAAGGAGEMVSIPATVPERLASRFVGYLKQAAGEVDITAADILVSVGRGIESPDNIPLAQALADAVGGVVSCSRPVADKKWLPKSRQVGTSGQTVKPKIYLALGISGAFQHVAGMSGAETIIAVNKDPKAPIFRAAHYGVVGDLFELLPLITGKIKAMV